MDSRSCDPLNLAATLGDMLDDYRKNCDDAVEAGVDKTTKEAKKLVKKYAKSAAFQKKKVGNEYVNSFSSKVTKEGAKTEGEVGSRKLPGLVHLLEKGHAKVGGGRTTAYPHMEPAFEDAKKEFIPNLEKELDKIK